MDTFRTASPVFRNTLTKYLKTNNRKMKDSIIIVSGGMDSVTLMHDYKDRIALAVTFDYGSNHNAREIECARRQCAALGIEHIVIPLMFMRDYFRSSLLEDADSIPEGHYEDENMKSTVVPFRNGIMLSIAAGLAESRGLTQVMIANHGGDHAVYPDCRPGFIAAMDRAVSEGTYADEHIFAPYTSMTKADIARRGRSLGVDYSLTYSCYRGGAHHCGRCATCRERREALIAAGYEPDC